MFRKWLWALCASLNVGDALACAVCSVGPTVVATPTPNGANSSSFRLAVDARIGGARVGGGAGLVRVRDRRIEAAFSYAPSERLRAQLAVPVLLRTIESPGSAVDRVSMGDLDGRLTYVPTTDIGKKISFFAGIKAPSAPVQADSFDRTLAAELQPGCSAMTPYLGASVAHSFSKLTLTYGAMVLLPFSVREAPHPGDSLRATVSFQYAATRYVAVRFGLNARAELSGELRPLVDDPNSGGLIGYVTAGVIANPTSALSFSIDAMIPALQGLRGEHRELSVFALSASYAF